MFPRTELPSHLQDFHDVSNTPAFTKTSLQRNLSTCVPKHNIMFLKTHKCASSTLQNIFMRFGDTHNLTFVLPPHGNYMGHPAKFTSNLTISLPSVFAKEYNIFCHHTRWDETEIVRIMPSDTVFISALKEPSTMFVSLYDYFELNKRYKTSLERFLKLQSFSTTTTVTKHLPKTP